MHDLGLVMMAAAILATMVIPVLRLPLAARLVLHAGAVALLVLSFASPVRIAIDPRWGNAVDLLALFLVVGCTLMVWLPRRLSPTARNGRTSVSRFPDP